MSEQERYGQEPYRPREPYAPYAHEYPQQGQRTEGWTPGDPYPADPEARQEYDPAAWDPRQYPHHPQQPQPQQPYAAPYPGQYQQPQHPGQQQPYGYQQPQYQETYQVPGQRVQEARPPAPDEPAGQPPAAGQEGEFHTEEFAFVEEEDEQAEDVIDWLKFSESRTERRDERKRRGRKRTIALIVLLALALAGGVGYLWQAGLIPGFGPGSTSVPLAAQKRDVIVVHLREVDSDDSSTALLVRNETTGKGTMVLLPNTLSVSTDDGSTTLGRSVVDEGAGPTRDALSTLLGSRIQGTWRLDTPYLEILVDAVGGITVDSDVTVVSGGKTVVSRGNGQPLNGQDAIAYATYRAPGESEQAQLDRFGQVMRAVLMKLPSDTDSATKIVDELGAVPDPSLSDGQLGATLAALSDLVKSGDYTTTTLPVQLNGTISEQATNEVVKNVLGGAVKNTDTSGIPTVAVENGSGDPKAPGAAQVQIVNSGDTYVDGGQAAPRATSEVLYTAVSNASAAKELATTLGLPAREVRKGAGSANADITVMLGRDYRPGAA